MRNGKVKKTITKLKQTNIMSNDSKTLIKEYKLGETQERIHGYLIDVKKCYMDKSWFEKNQEKFLNKYKDFLTFDYYANIYLWETFFKYDSEILKFVVRTAKETFLKNKEASEAERAVIFFFYCMTISPKDAPPIEKKVTKKEEEHTPLTLESLLEGIE